MEPLQQQILTVSHKLDALYQFIEQLDLKVAQAFSECSLARTEAKDYLQENRNTGYSQFKRHNMSFSAELEHKDILTDGIYLDMNRQDGERTLSPEIQIQRLTAQLTAAYNRIAALEEQLLKERIH